MKSIFTTSHFYLFAFMLLTNTSHSANSIKRKENRREREGKAESSNRSARNQSKARNSCKIKKKFLSLVCNYSENNLTQQGSELLCDVF